MGELENNAVDRAGAQLSSWLATFNQLRRKIGTSIAILVLLIFAALAVWWNWDQLTKKPGVDQLVQWIARSIGLHSAGRLGQFTVEFQKFGPSDPNPDTRYWNWTGKLWQEKAPSGQLMYHDLVAKISLDGCEGDLTKKESDPELQFFIPHAGCRDMTLRFNFRGNGWQPFGAIIDPR
jgi:hypothetical protein